MEKIMLLLKKIQRISLEFKIDAVREEEQYKI